MNRSAAALLSFVLVAGCAAPETESRWTPAGNTGANGEILAASVPQGHTGAFTTWWGADRPREVGTYVDGLRHGAVTVYYADGTIQMQGEFAGGEPVGELTHHYEGGAGPALQQELVDGKVEGPRKTFDEQGNLRSLTHHRGGVLHGEETRWHANGRLAVVGQWSHGEQVGTWYHHDPEGRVISETRHVGSVSLETVFDASGRAASQTHERSRDGRRTSTLTTWHDDGRQAGLVDSVDGRRHGRDVTWSESGRPLIVGTRRDDVRDGTWTFFTNAGQLDRQVRYEAGQEVGVR